MANKQYTSVSDMLRDTISDKSFLAEFDEHVAARRLVKEMLALRAVRGLSQRDVADRMDCTQSRISKLENARDADVRLGDFQAYADAVGCDFVAQPIPRDMEPAEKVKCLVHTVKKHMDDLSQLAKADEGIAEGVALFFGECLLNFSLMLGESARSLPLRADASPYFHLEIRAIEEGEEAPEDESSSSAGCCESDGCAALSAGPQ